MGDIKVLVVTHKEYWMPDDAMYLPIQVGYKNGGKDLGYIKDNSGDNISEKNRNYCELTALYWAWKNLQADYVGLVHYRRHFSYKGAKGEKKEKVLDSNTLRSLLKQYDVILPKQRNYFIETNYSQYVHAHHKEDLDITRQIIQEIYPDYLCEYDEVMKKTTGHRFNMFIMKYEKFDEYCNWLYSILFELEKRLDISDYSAYDARVFGFVSERLLDVWLNTKNYSYVDIPYVFMEKQNWITKGMKFLKRKALGSN